MNELERDKNTVKLYMVKKKEEGLEVTEGPNFGLEMVKWEHII